MIVGTARDLLGPRHTFGDHVVGQFVGRRSEDAPLTWGMPVEFLPFTGLLALAFALPRAARPTSYARLFGEVLIIGVGTSVACMAT